jgi:hypothetical protein
MVKSLMQYKISISQNLNEKLNIEREIKGEVGKN